MGLTSKAEEEGFTVSIISRDVDMGDIAEVRINGLLAQQRYLLFVTASQVDHATSGALRYMARTKQRRTPAFNLSQRSRYSFSDPERMEG